jgi:hypothetical protein
VIVIEEFSSLTRYGKIRIGFLLLLVISLFVYGAATVLLHRGDDPSHLDADENEYYTLSGQIIDGKYRFDLRRPPTHIFVLSAVRALTSGNFMYTRVFISLIFSFVGPLLYILVYKVTHENIVALMSGLTAIFWPPFLFYGSTLYSETTALPLFILALIVIPLGSLVVGGTRVGWARSVAAGLLLGLCILARPMYLIFFSISAVIIFSEETNWAIAARRTLALAGGCFLLILPWSTYVTAYSGHPVFVSANGGETLAGGLNPALLENGYTYFVAPNERAGWDGPGKWYPDYKTGYLNKDEIELPYFERGKILQHRAIAWALQNPGPALRIQAAKLLYMWGFYPFWNGWSQTLLGNIPTIAAVALSILSIRRFWGHARQLSRFWLLPLFASVVALISWGSWRFRQPGDLGLIVLSVFFIHSVCTHRGQNVFGSSVGDSSPDPLGHRSEL